MPIPNPTITPTLSNILRQRCADGLASAGFGGPSADSGWE
jgi:hypothetical protein